jgi:glycosyltransferase involved in cell wall biosynthesis
VFLTISPDQHPNVEKLLTKIERLNLNSSLVNLGHIPYESIGAHFRNVDGMLMPSLLESFSTTYVEAMATSLPILTSDFDFARASCGNAATYFDPFSTDSIKNSIIEFRDNESLRFDLAQAGTVRVQFEVNTWNDIANTVISEAKRIAATN